MRGSFELGRHLRIHGDHDLLFLVHERVPFLHLLRNPAFEFVTDHGRKDINQPLLWDLWHIDLFRQVHIDDWMVCGVFQDLIDRQVLVLRDVDRFDLVVRDMRLSPTHDVLQEVYGHIV